MASVEELADSAVQAAQASLDASEAVRDAIKAQPPDPGPDPPDPEPPGGGTPFEQIWASTKQPVVQWNAVKNITSQQALQSWLGSRKANDHVKVTGFQFNGRLEIRDGGPCWLECDPTFKIRNAVKGTSNIGLWLVGVRGCHVTGFPQCFDCGNQGLRAQGARDCYVEVDCFSNGGNGALIDSYNGRPSGIFKITGGGNGRGAMPPGSPGYEAAYYTDDMDPHAQKGTGVHMANVWQLDPGSVVLVDCDKEQKYGAGMQTTELLGTNAAPIVLAIRAKSLSCDVNVLPPSSSGGRQSGGNGWQPWGGAHKYVTVKSIELGSCAQGIDSASSYQNCTVEYGRVDNHRLSPVWDSSGGIVLKDVAPKP
jgi:hypothetical protein